MSKKNFQDLVDIFKKLRDPVKGCPWDLKQTHQSLKQYVIEEAYEVVDAIDKGAEELKKELGDLLLQVMLHSQIGSDEKTFTIDDVIDSLATKLIVRHPHVFGSTEVKDSEEVLKNWEKIKESEKKASESILDGVPNSMPALLRAQRISVKAARVGFEWENLTEIRDKVLEEVEEFAEECVKPEIDKKALADEFGDIFFALVQLARRLDLDAEDLLQQSTNKFSRRFREMEKRAGRPISEMSLEDLDKLWDMIKREEKK